MVDANADDQGATTGATGIMLLPNLLPSTPGPVAKLVPRALAKAVFSGVNDVDPAELKLGTGGVVGSGCTEDEQAVVSCVLGGAGVAASDIAGGIRLGVLATAIDPPLEDALPGPEQRGGGNVPSLDSLAAPRGVRGVPDSSCVPAPSGVNVRFASKGV